MFLNLKMTSSNNKYKMLFTLLFIIKLIALASSSSMFLPPKTALVVGFEETYDLSLLANSLTDNGISSTLIIPAESDIYEHLVEVDVLKLNFTLDKTSTVEIKALKACESLLTDKNILQRVEEIQPTFVVFPALRHDGCLLPWTRFIGSIPVIWASGIEQEHYAVEKTKVAIPISTEGIYDRFWTNINYRTVILRSQSNYVKPAINLAKQYLKNYDGESIDQLYSNVNLVFWGGDPILRKDFAALTHRFVESGCHQCRGPKPLPEELQKELITFGLGTIMVTLDENFSELIKGISRQLPQGRLGQAILWKTKFSEFTTQKPENLFLHSSVDRQDIIGYGRARVLVSHCVDSEFLEASYHGTPMICVPRTPQEMRNAQRAVELGLSVPLNKDYTVEKIVDTIANIHENGNFRARAKSVSLAVRGRPIPVTDLLIFWLNYIAKSDKDVIEFSPIEAGTPVKTFSEDIQLYIGMLVGTIFGILFAGTSALSWYIQKKPSNKLGKTKVKRHNK